MSSLLHRLQSLWVLSGNDFSATIRVRQRLVFAGLALALLWYLVRPTPLALMAIFALGGFILAAYLWARQMAERVRGQRRLVYAALQVGDELEEIVTLRNDSFLPLLYAEVRDRSSFPEYTLSSVRAAGAGSTLEWRARAVCSRRGVFTLGPWDILTGDPFGIFSVTHTYNQRVEVLVYPPLAALPPGLLPRGQMQGDERPLHQPTAAESLNAVTTRPFQPGDPLRRLHWPTSARREAPFVKVFQPQASATFWLAPDLDAAAQAGEGADSTLETTITLLASLAAELLKQRMAVGLLTVGSEAQALLPQRGQEHFWQILRALAALQAAPGCPFAATLAKARGLLSPQDVLLAVTPSLSTDWIAPLHQINRGPQRRAEVILLDAASFVPGGDGKAAPGSEKAAAFVLTLAQLGISARVVRRGDLTPVAGIYGELQRWEFITGGTGRAIARRTPRGVRLSPNARWGRP